jgi:predicted Zn finger-like uncharacterized protein
MVIECKNCSRKFNLDANLLKPKGSKVRCTKCGDIFLAFPPAIETIETLLATVKKIGSSDVGFREPDALSFEKRMHRRIKVSVPASCISMDSEGNSVDYNIGRITDISQDGLVIEIFCSSLSELALISFITLDDKEIQIVGKVVHSERNSKGRTKIGVSLTGTTKEISDFVSNVVRYHHYTTRNSARANEAEKV